MYHVQETQPTWLLKEMQGKYRKPQVFHLNLKYVVKGCAAKAVYSVGFSTGVFLLQRPLGFPSRLYYPITVSDVLEKGVKLK